MVATNVREVVCIGLKAVGAELPALAVVIPALALRNVNER